MIYNQYKYSIAKPAKTIKEKLKIIGVGILVSLVLCIAILVVLLVIFLVIVVPVWVLTYDTEATTEVTNGFNNIDESLSGLNNTTETLT